MVTIEFTPEALKDLTPQQRDQLVYQAGPHTLNIFVTKDFSLPEDYIAVHMRYRSGTVIYGGIDAEGRLNT